MKPTLPLPALLLAVALSAVNSVPGQEPRNPAAAIAAKQAAEERFKILDAKVEDLWAAQAALQKRLDQLSNQINQLNQEQIARQDRFVTRDEFNKLVDAINEIDKKREADKKLILEELRKLSKAPAPSPRPSPAPANSPPRSVMQGYEYTVQPGDTISSIVAAYNEAFKEQNKGRITTDDVQQANPDLKPNKIFPGQVIFIPAPATR